MPPVSKRTTPDWIPLAILTFFLSLSGLGYLPVPGTVGPLTLLHIPVILAGVLSGPGPGAGVGLIFGLTNLYLMAPHDPVVQVIPRVLCGLLAGLIFWAGRRHGRADAQISLASVTAAAGASLAHTVMVSGLASLRGHLPGSELVSVFLFHGLPEAMLAVLVTLPLAVVRKR